MPYGSLGINEDYVVFEVTSPSSNKLVDLKGTKDDGPKGSLHKTMDFAIDVFNEVCSSQIYSYINKSHKAIIFLINFVPISVWEIVGASRYGFIAFCVPGQDFPLEK